MRRLVSLNRDLRLYLVASATIGFTILNGIFPVLFNLYLLRLGHGPEFVGLVNAVGLLGYALFSFPAGIIAQRLGTRRTMTMGVFVTMVCAGLQPMVEFAPLTWQQGWILVNRAFMAIGLALYFVNATSFLTDATRPGERPHVYSVRMAFDTLSGFLGSLAGGALPGLFALLLGTTLAQPAPYRYSLLTAAVLALPAVLSLLWMREAGDHCPDPVGELPAADPLPWSLLAGMSLVVLLRASGVGTSRTFFNVYLDDGLGVPTAQIGVLFAVIQLVAVPAALVMPALSGRWGTYRVVIWASLGVAASTLPLALVPHWALATLGRMGIYALSSIADPALNVYQMELVPPRWRSVMAGASSTALGLSWTALAFGGGFLIAGLGYRALFLLAGALTVGGTVLFWTVFRRR